MWSLIRTKQAELKELYRDMLIELSDNDIAHNNGRIGDVTYRNTKHDLLSKKAEIRREQIKYHYLDIFDLILEIEFHALSDDLV